MTNNEVPLIIDFEGYRGRNNQLCVKEVSILDVNNDKAQTVVLKPSLKNRWENLRTDIKKTNQYIKYNLHGIAYNFGYCEYHQIYKILRRITKNNNYTIYSKGDEKCEVLSYICHQKVHDLNNFINKHKYVNIKNTYVNNINCFNPHYDPNTEHCSLKKVYFYKTLLLFCKL